MVKTPGTPLPAGVAEMRTVPVAVVGVSKVTSPLRLLSVSPPPLPRLTVAAPSGLVWPAWPTARSVPPLTLKTEPAPGPARLAVSTVAEPLPVLLMMPLPVMLPRLISQVVSRF